MIWFLQTRVVFFFNKMSGIKMIIIWILFGLYTFCIQSRNTNATHVCGIHGYNYNTKYGYYMNDYIYKYPLNNNNSISLINTTKIDDVNRTVNFCKPKWTQINNKIYIINDELIISMYDMNKEIYYNNYINTPLNNIKCNINQLCITSDNNSNLYIICNRIFYYYSSNTNKWIKGNNLKYSNTNTECVYSNNKFYVINGMGIQFININKDIGSNEFNQINNFDWTIHSES